MTCNIYKICQVKKSISVLKNKLLPKTNKTNQQVTSVASLLNLKKVRSKFWRFLKHLAEEIETHSQSYQIMIWKVLSF